MEGVEGFLGTGVREGGHQKVKAHQKYHVPPRCGVGPHFTSYIWLTDPCQQVPGQRWGPPHSLRPVVPDCVTVQQCQMPHFSVQSHSGKIAEPFSPTATFLFNHTHHNAMFLQLPLPTYCY